MNISKLLNATQPVLLGATTIRIEDMRAREQPKVTIELSGKTVEWNVDLYPADKYLTFYRVWLGETNTGRGTLAFCCQVLAFRRLGFETIGLKAVRNDSEGVNGYYTWPRWGFVPRDDEDATPLPDILKGVDLLKVMETQQGRDWWKENGQSHSGLFDLREGSRSMQVFDKYVQQKWNIVT